MYFNALNRINDAYPDVGYRQSQSFVEDTGLIGPKPTFRDDGNRRKRCLTNVKSYRSRSSSYSWSELSACAWMHIDRPDFESVLKLQHASNVLLKSASSWFRPLLLRLAQLQQPSLSDRRDASNWLEDRLRHLAIESHQRNRISAPGLILSPQRKRRNVHALLAER